MLFDFFFFKNYFVIKPMRHVNSWLTAIQLVRKGFSLNSFLEECDDSDFTAKILVQSVLKNVNRFQKWFCIALGGKREKRNTVRDSVKE